MTDDIFGEYAKFSNDAWDHTGHRDPEKRKELWLLNVLINPSNVELARSCRKAGRGGLRGLWIDDDLYWWAARYGTHGDGLSWTNSWDRGRDITIEAHVYDDGLIGVTATTHEIVEQLCLHRTLVGKFTDDGSLIET